MPKQNPDQREGVELLRPLVARSRGLCLQETESLQLPNRPPEQVMTALKAYCSSKLNRWARHGSITWLINKANR